MQAIQCSFLNVDYLCQAGYKTACQQPIKLLLQTLKCNVTLCTSASTENGHTLVLNSAIRDMLGDANKFNYHYIGWN